MSTIYEIEVSIKNSRRVPVRKVASVVRQVISISIVIGKISQLMTRYLSMDVLSANTWSSYLKLSSESLDQLDFWKFSLSEFNIKSIFDFHICLKIVYSDASSSGFDGYKVNTPDGISHGMCRSFDESLKSSIWRELTAVYLILSSLKGS